MSAVVIESRFDNMRLDAETGHTSCGRPSQIVHVPRRDPVAKPLIELRLVSAPRHEARAALTAEQKLAAVALDRRENFPCRRRQRDRVRAMVLAPHSRQHPDSSRWIVLVPFHAADLLPARAE